MSADTPTTIDRTSHFEITSHLSQQMEEFTDNELMPLFEERLEKWLKDEQFDVTESPELFSPEEVVEAAETTSCLIPEDHSLEYYETEENDHTIDFWEKIAKISLRYSKRKPIDPNCDLAHWFQEQIAPKVRGKFLPSHVKEAAEFYARLRKHCLCQTYILTPLEIVSKSILHHRVRGVGPDIRPEVAAGVERRRQQAFDAGIQSMQKAVE